MRGIDTIYGDFHEKGLVCFGVTSEGPEKDAEIREIVKTYQFSFPTLLHAGDVMGDGKPYPMPAMPTVYIIDRKGAVSVARYGPITEKLLRDDLKKLGFEK